MTEAEIKNTSLRVQYWMKRIKESEDKLQQCESLEEAVAYIDKGKKPDKRMSPMDIQCLKHAIEVSPIRCPPLSRHLYRISYVHQNTGRTLRNAVKSDLRK